jgi:ribosomal-protein-alanine N-acetyltransferase
MREPRELSVTDLDRVVEIEKVTFPDPWSRRAFLETLARPDVRGVALDDDLGRLVGYGVCVRAADEGEILNLAVAGGARRQGAGRRLLDSMVAWLRGGGATRVFLEVRRSNEAAIGLYLAAGFRSLAARPAYYSNPREDALTMVLDLSRASALK